MKKFFATALSLVILCNLLSACGGPAAALPPDDTNPVSPSALPGESEPLSTMTESSVIPTPPKSVPVGTEPKGNEQPKDLPANAAPILAQISGVTSIMSAPHFNAQASVQPVPSKIQTPATAQSAKQALTQNAGSQPPAKTTANVAEERKNLSSTESSGTQQSTTQMADNSHTQGGTAATQTPNTAFTAGTQTQGQSSAPSSSSKPTVDTVPDKTDAPSMPESNQTQSIEKIDTDAYARQVVDLVNQARHSAGLTELVLADELMSAAQLRAEELTQNFSHTRPDGSSCQTAYTQFNSYTYWGENIASGQHTPELVIKAWMNSDGHRANILGGDTDAIGVGSYQHQPSGRYYWVQVFGIDKNWYLQDEVEPQDDQNTKLQVQEPDEEPTQQKDPDAAVSSSADQQDGRDEAQHYSAWELENYRPAPQLTLGEAAQKGHCLLFVNPEDGRLYKYSCHQAKGEPLENFNGGVFECGWCSDLLEQMVRYRYEGGQVYIWNC